MEMSVCAKKNKAIPLQREIPTQNVFEEDRDGGPWVPRAHVPGRPRTKPKGLATKSHHQGSCEARARNSEPRVERCRAEPQPRLAQTHLTESHWQNKTSL